MPLNRKHLIAIVTEHEMVDTRDAIGLDIDRHKGSEILISIGGCDTVLSIELTDFLLRLLKHRMARMTWVIQMMRQRLELVVEVVVNLSMGIDPAVVLRVRDRLHALHDINHFRADLIMRILGQDTAASSIIGEGKGLMPSQCMTIERINRNRMLDGVKMHLDR